MGVFQGVQVNLDKCMNLGYPMRASTSVTHLYFFFELYLTLLLFIVGLCSLCLNSSLDYNVNNGFLSTLCQTFMTVWVYCSILELILMSINYKLLATPMSSYK
jgi:hypothetical protein